MISSETRMTHPIPRRIQLAHRLTQLWPFLRGRGRMVQFILNRNEAWPERARASFSFRYGRFVDAPIAPWPRGYRDLFLYGLSDIVELAMWHRVLTRGMTVVDGGANWGYWSLVAARLVGRSGSVHAFEPVPATAGALQTNVRASRADNVTIHQAALAERGGVTRINLVADDPIGGQSGSGKPGDRRSSTSCECKSVTLDDALQDRPVGLIKLDVEGGELAALRGAQGILRRSEKPIVTFEWNRVTAAALGYQPEAIADFLGGHGYELLRATEGGFVRFEGRSDAAQWSPMVWALTEAQQTRFGSRRS
jgi:FkbM family methyltransferase